MSSMMWFEKGIQKAWGGNQSGRRGDQCGTSTFPKKLGEEEEKLREKEFEIL